MKRSLLLAAAPVLALGAYLQPYRPVMVKGHSMAGTLKDGEVLLARRPVGPLRVGDVVVVSTPSGAMVKRIAFVAGDEVRQYRTVRGEWRSGMDLGMPKKGRMVGRVRMAKIPAGQVFLLGDNSADSVDSRDFGPVPASAVTLVVPSEYEPSKVLARSGGVRRNISLVASL